MTLFALKSLAWFADSAPGFAVSPTATAIRKPPELSAAMRRLLEKLQSDGQMAILDEDEWPVPEELITEARKKSSWSIVPVARGIRWPPSSYRDADNAR